MICFLLLSTHSVLNLHFSWTYDCHEKATSGLYLLVWNGDIWKISVRPHTYLSVYRKLSAYSTRKAFLWYFISIRPQVEHPMDDNYMPTEAKEAVSFWVNRLETMIWAWQKGKFQHDLRLRIFHCNLSFQVEISQSIFHVGFQHNFWKKW